MANKVMSLHDAVEKYVQDNDVLCLGGFTTNRKPYAAVYEILRQGKTGFVGWSGPAGGDWDSLIGEGRVRAYINCYTANSGYTNVARRFRAAIEKGELTYEDYSQDVLMLQLHAASLGLPYLPVRMMQGSGLVKFWGISEEKRKTMEGVDNLKCVDIENPFEPGEKLLAVPVPKLDCAIIHVQQASPDGTCIIDGDEFHDVDIAIAAKRTIVTCEEQRQSCKNSQKIGLSRWQHAGKCHQNDQPVRDGPCPHIHDRRQRQGRKKESQPDHATFPCSCHFLPVPAPLPPPVPHPDPSAGA